MFVAATAILLLLSALPSVSAKEGIGTKDREDPTVPRPSILDPSKTPGQTPDYEADNDPLLDAYDDDKGGDPIVAQPLTSTDNEVPVSASPVFDDDSRPSYLDDGVNETVTPVSSLSSNDEDGPVVSFHPGCPTFSSVFAKARLEKRLPTG